MTTDYDTFESSSAHNRRLLRQEELILDATEVLISLLQKEGMSKSDLAARLGKTPEAVRQIFDGGRNLTLKTIARVADAAGYRVRLVAEKVAR